MATLTTIITEGLELGGNPGLSSGSNRALQFLKFLLRHLFTTYDWEFLKTTASAAANAGDYSIVSTAIPSDYRAIAQLSVDTEPDPMVQIPWERIERLRANQSALVDGKPTHFSVRETSGTRQILVWPKPVSRYTFAMLYYSLPDTSAYTGATENPFPDDQPLMLAVAHFAQAYDKEQLQVLIAQTAKSVWDEYRTSHRDQGRASVEILDWDPTTFKYLRGEE